MKRAFLLVVPLFILACSSDLPTTAVQSTQPSFKPTPPPPPPKTNDLQCFDGPSDHSIYGGTCTLSDHKDVATLANTDNNSNGDYAGVAILGPDIKNPLLTDITVLGYHWTGNIVPTPGDLSLNLPIALTGHKTTAYAFIDAAYCPGVVGTVDVINDPNCGIYYNGSVFYANWAAFVAAFPGARIANADAFIIAERTPGTPAATWTISDVMADKGNGK